MEFSTDPTMVAWYCSHANMFNDTYVGEDIDGNMTLTEVYGDYMLIITYMKRRVMKQWFYIDGSVETIYES